MTYADVAGQLQHVSLVKSVAYEAVAFALPESVLAPGHDASCILAAMLQYGQCVIDRLVDRLMGNNSYDTAHSSDHLLGRHQDFIALRRHNLYPVRNDFDMRDQYRALPPVVVIEAGILATKNEQRHE